MSAHADSATSTAECERPNEEWLLLWVAPGVIAVPRSQVRTVEQTEALVPAEAGEPETGWYTKPDEPWAAYSVDTELRLKPRRETERFTVFFTAAEHAVGLNCERLKILPAEAELPAFAKAVCMQNDGPIHALGLLDREEVVLITSGPALVDHLQKIKPQTEH